MFWGKKRRTVRAFMLASAALVAGAAPAAGQSLKSMRDQAAAESLLADEIGYTNTVCGAAIALEIDWSSLSGWPSDGQALARACGGALSAIEAVCHGGGAARVARGIDTFVCAGDGAGAAFGAGALTFGASPGETGYDETRALLEDAL
ncbi:MAG: hypothetical protein AAGC56_04485 [Pseudomonadota bacterium]